MTAYPPELLWRTGRKVGRTVYVQLGDEPSDDDVLIGVMDTPDMATTAVEARNLARFEGIVAIPIKTLNDLGAQIERVRELLREDSMLAGGGALPKANVRAAIASALDEEQQP